MANDKWKMLSSIIADRLNRTTTHRFFTQRSLFITFRLSLRLCVFARENYFAQRSPDAT